MEKRRVERIPVNMAVRFCCCDIHYSGTVKNLSEKGMFISIKEIHFPFKLRFNIIMPVEEKVLNIPANLNRITTAPDSRDAIGVELFSPPRDYLEFIDSLMSVYKA